MTLENVKKFLAQVQRDEALQKKILDGGVDAVPALAAEAGLPFSKSDLEAFQKGVAGELSDEDLEKVAGGWADPAQPTYGPGFSGGGMSPEVRFMLTGRR